MRPTVPALAALALTAGLLGACGSSMDDAEPGAGPATAVASESMTDSMTESMDDDTTHDDDMMDESSETATAAAGAYIDKAAYESSPEMYHSGKVVLFFHAPWCPTCRAVEESLTSAPVPDGLTVVKVDYDTENELRQRYGVTTQHTFVQVDASGNELAKWTTSTTADEILAGTV